MAFDLLNTLTRDTIDVGAVETAIHEASVRNYQTLLDIQNTGIGLKRIDIPFRDLIEINRLPSESITMYYPKRFAYYMGGSLIARTHKSAYFKSGLAGTALGQDIISKNKELFDHNFLVFIEGKMVTTCEMVCVDDEMTFILDIATSKNTSGISDEYYHYLKDNNVNITLLIVPNYTLGTTSFNMYTLAANNRILDKSRFTNFESFNDNTIFFINQTSDTSLLSISGAVLNKDNVTIPNEIPLSGTIMNLYGITIDNLTRIKERDFHGNWFSLYDKYTMPIPPKNILIFKKDSTTSVSVFDENIKPVLYYPTIYELTYDGQLDTQNDIDIYVFYKDDPSQPVDETTYVNYMELLHKAIPNVLEAYSQGNVPDIIKEYTPMDVTWFDGDDYRPNIYFPNLTKYNIVKISEYVESDPIILMNYLLSKIKSSDKFYINVSKLNLTNRIRRDTYSETELVGDRVQFSSNRYIFSIHKNFVGFKNMDFRIFIDNKLIKPDLYDTVVSIDYYHFYIPTEYVNSDSIIEVEKYEQYVNEYNFTNYTQGQVINIPVPEIGYMYGVDISIADLTMDLFLENSQFEVISYSDLVDEDIIIDISGHSRLVNPVKITIKDSKIYGHDLRVIVNHTTSIFYKYRQESDTSQIISTIIPNDHNIKSESIRVFLNGYLLPRSAYRILFDDGVGKNINVAIGVPINTQDTVIIDVMPYIYSIDYLEQLISDENGLIDTENNLSLPLDLRWYDIYLNGRKLNKYNIDIITDSKFFVKGIESLKNLYIYSKNNINTEFTFNHSDTIGNIIFDNMDDIREFLKDEHDVIEDEIEDILTGLSTGLIDHLEFVSNILQYSFINPNVKQLSPNIESMYPNMFDEYKILFLDCNSCPDTETVTFINSNIRSEIMKNDQYRYGFTPMYIGEHDDALNGEYLCDPITGGPGMKNADGTVISSYALNRLNTHREKFFNALIYANLGTLSIYNVEPDDNATVKLVTKNINLLDDKIELVDSDTYVRDFMVSIDLETLTPGYQNVMTYSDYEPLVTMVYTVNGVSNTVTKTIRELSDYVISPKGNNVVIKSITIVPTSASDKTIDTVKMILHSILIAF